MTNTTELLKEFLKKKESVEWQATENTQLGGVHNSLQQQLVWQYILSCLPPEQSVILDVGIDSGGFAIKLAQSNRRLVICDFSEEQLQHTREKVSKAKVEKNIEQFLIVDDLTDMSMFANDTFDMICCLSGTLSFTGEQRSAVLHELVRILKPGAPLVLTVRNKAQYYKNIIRNADIETLAEPIKTGLWEMLNSSYKQFEEFPREPMYYAFSATELENLLESVSCEVLEIGGINCLTNNIFEPIETIRENEDAWETLLKLERSLGTLPGLRDSGELIIAIARKKMF